MIYCFGISRRDKSAIISDVMKEEKAHLVALDYYDDECVKKECVLESYMEYGSLFCVFNDGMQGSFFEDVKILKPKVINKKISITFVDKKKIVLFKFLFKHDYKEIKKESWNVLQKLGIFTKKEFESQTKDMDDEYEYNYYSFIENEKSSACISCGLHSFLSVKSKDYSKLKKLVKENMG